MAVKRTKEHKLKQMEKQVSIYSLADVKTSAKGTQKKNSTTKSAPAAASQEMFGYPIHFIRQDLLKTFFITLIVVSVLIGIVYFDLR